MKIFGFLVLLTLSFRAHAFDHKKCVLDKVSAYLNAENPCFEETIKNALHKVMSNYSQCNLDFYTQMKDKSIESLEKNLSGNYDSEIETLFQKQFADCGITGSVSISEKGRKRSIQIIEIKGKGKRAEKYSPLAS